MRVGSLGSYAGLDFDGHLHLIGAQNLGHLLKLVGRELTCEKLDSLLFRVAVLIRVDLCGVYRSGFRVLVERPAGTLVEVGAPLLLTARVDSHICTWWRKA